MPPCGEGRDRQGKRRPQLRRNPRNLSFLQTFLLVFGFIAVFVGAFMIFNTFSITVAQRVSRVRRAADARRLAPPDPRLGPDRGVAIGLFGAVVGLAGGFVMATGLTRCSRRSVIDLPTTCLVFEIAHRDRRRCSSASSSPSSRRWFPRCARPGCRRSPPCTTSRRRPSRAAAGSSSRSRHLRRWSASRSSAPASSAAPGRRARAAGWAAAGPLIVIAVSFLSPPLVPPLATVAGRPLERLRRRDRQAGPRERAAQPESHRRHRGGADDRPGAGHLRDRLLGRAEELGGPGRRRKLRRRDGDPEQRRLLADPEPAPPSPRAQSPRAWGRRDDPRAQAKLLGNGARRSLRRPASATAVDIEWEQGGPRGPARAQRRRGYPLRLLRLRTDSSPATASSSSPSSEKAELRGRREFRRQARSLRQRPDHPGGPGPRIRADPGQVDFVQTAPGADPTRVQALLTKRRNGLPDRRSR